MHPRITVIIPTYNWSSVLPYSIGSVLRQTYADFELLIVGDGCTDDSEAVVNSIADERVVWVNLPSNTGHQSEPNNEGLRRARGEYVAYLGHDDLWFPHHLECLVNALDSGSDVAYGVMEVIGPSDGFRTTAPVKPQYSPGQWIGPTAVAHRRSMIDRIGGWRHYRELTVDPEVDLWQRAYEAGYKFTCVPRLTSLKFAAGGRPGIYKEKPNHEQSQWFERIHNTRDLEAIELGRQLVAAQALTSYSELGCRQMLYELLRAAAIRSREKLGRVSGRTKKPAKGEAVSARRLLKGLEPMP